MKAISKQSRVTALRVKPSARFSSPGVGNGLLALLTALLLHTAENVRAQSYSIDWFTIAGGGGTSTGGVYSVSATIGQPAAGRMTGGSSSVEGGFWSVIALHTPGGPPLSVAGQGGNVRVFWPSPATGFVLDHSPTVTGTWSQVAFPYTTNATEISITVPAPTGNKFYRLRKP